MIDWSSLVLAPCMGAFAKPIIVTPLVSQPMAAAYAARAIWESQHTDVMLDDGTVISSNQIDVGIRLAEFLVPPTKGDIIQVDGANYTVFDIRNDGQGGQKLVLRKAP